MNAEQQQRLKDLLNAVGLYNFLGIATAYTREKRQSSKYTEWRQIDKTVRDCRMAVAQQMQTIGDEKEGKEVPRS